MVNSVQHTRIAASASAPLSSSVRSPINYLGGKCRVADKLWTLRPDDNSFNTIIDPFGGGASTPLTFMRMGHGSKKKFLIRDIFVPTINFWNVLQQSPWELAYAVDDLLNAYPNGHDLEVACLAAINYWLDSGNHSVDAAAAYYIRTQISVPTKQFILDVPNYQPRKADKWLPDAKFKIGRLIRWSELIAGWEFKVQDFKATMAEAIALGDAAFSFIDPPYEGTTKRNTPELMYGVQFGKAEHDLLAELVTKVADAGGQAMVTINFSNLNLQRYACHHQLIRQQVCAQYQAGTKVKKVVDELVIRTYDSPFSKQAIANNNWKPAPSANDNQPNESTPTKEVNHV